MAIIREQTTLSLHELGDLFRKHHSSVAHAVKDVRQDCGRLAELYRAVTSKFA
jgi:chromosomal replication initiation ATPase DnaA